MQVSENSRAAEMPLESGRDAARDMQVRENSLLYHPPELGFVRVRGSHVFFYQEAPGSLGMHRELN